MISAEFELFKKDVQQLGFNNFCSKKSVVSNA